MTIKLGDPLNGYRAQTEVRTMAEVLPWLQRAIAKHYPNLTYIKSLGSDAPTPLHAETVSIDICAHRCPVCGEINSFPGWSEMSAFVCKFCGEPVEVRSVVQ